MIFFSILSIFSLITISHGYLKVLLITGIVDNPHHLDLMADAINKAHEGTDASIVNVDEGLTSTIGMKALLELYKEKVLPIMQENPQGIHLIGHSQGTLICRGLIQTIKNHNVKVFISLAGPLMGQFGVPVVDGDLLGINKFLSGKSAVPVLRDIAWTLFYNVPAQDSFSAAGYWRDPNHYQQYLDFSCFLAYINNEKHHAEAADYKANFIALDKLVLIAGPNDGVICPWQSGFFASDDGTGKIIPMKEQPVYSNDSFGLKTLDERGAVVMHEMPGILHIVFPTDPTVIDYVIPLLY